MIFIINPMKMLMNGFYDENCKYSDIPGKYKECNVGLLY